MSDDESIYEQQQIPVRIPALVLLLRSRRYFWQCQTRVGYGPATGPTLKTALCHTCPVVGRMTNTNLGTPPIKGNAEGLKVRGSLNVSRLFSYGHFY